MIKQKIIDWMNGHQLFGVSLFVTPDGEWQTDVVELKKRSGSVSLVQKQEELGGADDLWTLLPKNAGISLNVNGAGILYKRVSSDKAELGLESILPNVNPEDFIIQKLEMTEGNVLVAVLRKDVLKTILKTFKSHQLWVVDLWLGPVCLQGLSTLLGRGERDLLVNGMNLHLINGQVHNYQKSEEQCKEYFQLGEESLWGNQVLTFASALSGLAIGNHNKPAEDVHLSSQEYFARKVLLKGGTAALILIFLLVLVNFFVFDSLRNKQAQLSAQVETGRSLLGKLDAMRADVKQKEDFLMKSGLNSQSKLSFYADRIAADLPGSIRLTSLEVNPLQKKIKKGKEIQYTNGNILVEGKTTYAVDLNRWIRDLKKEDWVVKVVKQEYALKRKDQPAEFVLEINVN